MEHAHSIQQSNEIRQWNQAINKARRNFGFFWRELYWDSLRTRPRVEFAAVLVNVTEGEGSEEVHEQIWITQIYTDGASFHGCVLNPPTLLRSVRVGQFLKRPVKSLIDWIYVVKGRAYGAYTVNLYRSKLNVEERAQHDFQWGYHFGDFNMVQRYPEMVRSEKEKEEDKKEDEEIKTFLGMQIAPQPKNGERAKFLGMALMSRSENGGPTKFLGMNVMPQAKDGGTATFLGLPLSGKFTGAHKVDEEEKDPDEELGDINQRYDHPVAIRLHDTVVDFFQQHKQHLTDLDGRGKAFIHDHALAGNRHLVRNLLELGVPANLPMHDGRTAKDLAKAMGWIAVVSELAKYETRKGPMGPPPGPGGY